MSSLVAPDMPLADGSTGSFMADWEQCQYTLPSPPPSEMSSPSLSAALLKARLTPDYDMCMSTSQVFDMDDGSSQDDYLGAMQMGDSASLVAGDGTAAKKSRYTKDFVPPDVSGLSKREARLVKNRAAAFLSRQRKREEFENMEIRVVQLEQENARLLALANSGSADPNYSEIESLRAQLAAAQAREQQLSSKLSEQLQEVSPVKLEVQEPSLVLPAPLKSLAAQLPNKSGASFGLMVLLCALPSLLSMQTTQATIPTKFSIPTSASSFDFSTFIPNDYHWSRPVTHPSFDVDDHSASSVFAAAMPTTTRKLEFLDAHASSGLAGLDVSFDTSTMADGRIRVKIHNPTPTSNAVPTFNPDSDIYASAPSNDPSAHAMAASSEDPFFGMGPRHDTPTSPASSPYATPTMATSLGDINYDLNDLNYDVGSEYTVERPHGIKRRVRIALKSMPSSGGEGGEWEVEVC